MEKRSRPQLVSRNQKLPKGIWQDERAWHPIKELILGEQHDWLWVCGLSSPELRGGTVPQLHGDSAGQRLSKMSGRESCILHYLKELDFSWEMMSLKLFWFYFCSKLTFNESNKPHLLSSLVDQLSAVTFQLLRCRLSAALITITEGRRIEDCYSFASPPAKLKMHFLLRENN